MYVQQQVEIVFSTQESYTAEELKTLIRRKKGKEKDIEGAAYLLVADFHVQSFEEEGFGASPVQEYQRKEGRLAPIVQNKAGRLHFSLGVFYWGPLWLVSTNRMLAAYQGGGAHYPDKRGLWRYYGRPEDFQMGAVELLPEMSDVVVHSVEGVYGSFYDQGGPPLKLYRETKARWASECSSALTLADGWSEEDPDQILADMFAALPNRCKDFFAPRASELDRPLE